MWWYQCVYSTLTRGSVEHVRPKHARARARALSLSLHTHPPQIDECREIKIRRGRDQNKNGDQNDVFHLIFQSVQQTAILATLITVAPPCPYQSSES